MPPTAPYVLAIDLGTSGVKVAVVDAGGVVVAGSAVALATTFLPDGGAEQDADVWRDAIGHAASTAFPLMCTDNREWAKADHADELLELAGLDRSVVAPIVPADEPLGPLTGEAAEHLGVARGTLVMPATVDSITSAIGCGAIDA